MGFERGRLGCGLEAGRGRGVGLGLGEGGGSATGGGGLRLWEGAGAWSAEGEEDKKGHSVTTAVDTDLQLCKTLPQHILDVEIWDQGKELEAAVWVWSFWGGGELRGPGVCRYSVIGVGVMELQCNRGKCNVITV